MSKRRIQQLRGASRLATSAARGLTDLVEAMHGGFARIPGTTPAARTGGISGLVYHGVRGIAGLVGTGVDLALQRLEPLFDAGDPPASPSSEALLAALNGVFGDYLAATDNPLAIAMHLRLPQQPGPRPLLLLHGLCMNERPWQRGGFVERIEALGYSPILLRYNSGLHISENGRRLAALLEQALRGWPTPIQDLTLIGHSMGGLLARSAVHHGAGMAWPRRLSRLITLGAPHLGAPLEQGGQALQLLQAGHQRLFAPAGGAGAAAQCRHPGSTLGRGARRGLGPPRPSAAARRRRLSGRRRHHEGPAGQADRRWSGAAE